MNQPIEAIIPRATAGGAIRAQGESPSKWRHFLPIYRGGEVSLANPETVKHAMDIPSGSLLNARHSGKSLRPRKRDMDLQRKRRKLHLPERMPKRTADGLWVILTRDLGVKPTVASSLCRLPLREYRRVEEAIEGVVDSLFCANPNYFTPGTDDLKTIKNLVKGILGVGAYNRPILVDYWKQWTNWLKHTIAGTTLIGGEAPLDSHNLYRTLNNLSDLRRIIPKAGQRLLRSDLAIIGHLTSTRQMPYMGKSVEEKSLGEFAEVITSEPPNWKGYKDEIAEAVKAVARKCRSSRGKIPIHDGTAHISVTSSGEMEGPVRKGGQAYTVSKRMKEGLTKILPPGVEHTPFGDVEHPGDMELWKYLFRDGYRYDKEFLSDKVFMDEWTGGKIPHTVEGYFYGLDGALGQQLMYLAWKDALSSGYPRVPPEIRASTVAETGNKARIVTVSHWWLNVLESPMAHWLVELLRYHPSCFSAFQRQDQAWSFLTSRDRNHDRLYGGEPAYACLSSDLKNATNAIPLDLMRFMWREFITEYGYEFSEYMDFCINLIDDRIVLFPEGSKVYATRGLPMGEALAKPSLTLWALTAEQLAFNRFMKEYRMNPRLKGNNREDFSRILSWVRESGFTDYDAEAILGSYHTKAWHFFHLGGDDHVAYGPRAYLDLVTKSFQDLGAMLSPGKHGYSRTFVQYCERILDVHRTDKVQIIDTMKVRLLSTGQSTGITRDQKNVAIGKAAQFSKYMSWAAPIDGWSMGKKVCLQALWMSRMGAFLPSPSCPEFYAVLLPQKIGGYGLGFPSQYEEALNATDPIFTQLVNYLLSGPPGEEAESVTREFGAMVRNPSSRGIAVVTAFEDEVRSTITLYPGQYDAITWKQLCEDERFADEDRRQVVAKAAAAGVISSAEYAKRITRGSLFRELIMKPESAKPYNTVHYRTALSELKKRIYSNAEKYNSPGFVSMRLSPATPTWEPGTLNLDKVLYNLQPSYFIDSNAPMTFVTGARIKDPEFGEWIPIEWTFEEFPRVIPQRDSGRPDMVLGLSFVGLDRKASAPKGSETTA